MVSSTSYEKILGDVEGLSQTRPMDTPTTSTIEKMAAKFFQEIVPELKNPVFKKIAQSLRSLCSLFGLQVDAKIANLIQGMRFFIAIRHKEELYLELGSLYANKRIQNAEEHIKNHQLNPTYAIQIWRSREGEKAKTAIAQACHEGDIKIVESLVPKVDLNFAISSSDPSTTILPALLGILAGKSSNDRKIEMLRLFKKYTFTPLLRNHEDWWLCDYFINRNHYKRPPEVLHALLEGVSDLSEACYSLSRSRYSILDRSISHLHINSAFVPNVEEYLEAFLNNAIVMASHGIPRYIPQISHTASLRVRNKEVTLEGAEKIHEEEKRKLQIIQQKCLNAMNAVLSTSLDVDTTGVVTSYVVLSERSLRILTARSCFKRIFGYAPYN